MTSPTANQGAADADVQHKNKDRKAERARQKDPQRTFQKAFLSFCHRQLLFMTSTCEINAKVRQSFFNRVENSRRARCRAPADLVERGGLPIAANNGKAFATSKVAPVRRRPSSVCSRATAGFLGEAVTPYNGPDRLDDVR